jgi:1-acyl-sn-glycerol-3-phosphate acyltransferase
VSIGNPVIFSVARAVTRWYMQLKGGMRVIGRENVPPKGGVILAPNHVSYLDPPLVANGLSRMMASMAKAELWNNPYFAWIMTGVAAFPVSRGTSDREAIRTGLKRLEDGHPLLLFPEGTRGDGVTLGKFNSGVALFARRSGAPVVPIGIYGTQFIMPKEGKSRRAVSTVAFGKPIYYDQAGTDDDFNARLAREILAIAEAQGWPLRAPE